LIQQAAEINQEAKKIGIELDKSLSNNLFGKRILNHISRLVHSFELQQAEAILDIFGTIKQLELEIDISEAQNIYFSKIFHRAGELIDSNKLSNKRFVDALLNIGDELNINTEFYRHKADKVY
ncbi:hypothetical protein II810_04855, partial [bacterium]|nr:hypothetical protein [bacterium]